MSAELAIVLTASLTAAACALVGTFLVLRKMALLGDAISHAVLPGIALAFLWTGRLNSLPMLLGAGAMGLVTVALIEALYRTRRLAEDSAIGVVFPALFALGVLLITTQAGQVHIDAECVLYGEIAFVPFNRLVWGGADLGPRALWVLGGVTLLNAAFVALCWKELKAGTFDPTLAAMLGLAPGLVHYLLMGAVSVTTVAAFESVGAILVVALLIVPAATAYLLTQRLSRMLGLAVADGVLAAVGGYGLARVWDASVAGGMALVAGGLFAGAWLLAPRQGVLARRLEHKRRTRQLAGDLLLTHLAEAGDRPLTLAEVIGHLRWRPRLARRVVVELRARGWVTRTPDDRVSLTPAGRSRVREFHGGGSQRPSADEARTADGGAG